MLHLFHTVGIRRSFLKKKKKLCYTIFCKLWCANILAGLYSIVADCVTLY